MTQVFPKFVRTFKGVLEGQLRLSAGGANYTEFLGIPYALPPTGRRRFAPPEPISEAWTGVRECRTYGSKCAQYDYVFRTVVGSEDCLTLNVFSRASAPTDRLPVLVWIHGGGFVIGSGDDELYGPTRAMDEEMVLVTLNYRVGVLGFLATQDGRMPGNLGIKDQQLALKWIKENVGFFGGDTSNITLMGESAGASSIHFHLLYGKKKGLFHKAILQSGSAFCSWAWQLNPDDYTHRVAKKLGAFDQETAKIRDKLRAVPVEDLVMALPAIPRGQIVPPLPIIEGQGGFITCNPASAVRSGSLKDIPILMGHNSEEGAVQAAVILPRRKTLEKMNSDPAALADAYYFDYYGLDKKAKLELAQRLKKRYFGDEKIGADTAKQLVQSLGDEMFVHPVYTACKLHNQHMGPVYAYVYAYKGENSFTQMMNYFDQDLGVSHFDEVLLQFDNKVFDDLNEQDKKISKLLWKTWTNFARTGRPTANPADWPPFDAKESHVLIRKEGFVRKAGMRNSNMSFWDEVARARLSPKSKL